MKAKPSVIDQQDPKVFIRLDDGTECETTTYEELNLEREFVYGTHYIDEQIVQYDAAGAPYYVLQDANFNLTGLTTSSGAIHQKYSFGPYGRYTAVCTIALSFA